ncbi:PTS sugar transporter subunit IIA [Bifidobacterium tsurumiense]|uniref:Putative phosphoenolpyruvate-dependent sugar phosphotransferase system, EIIA 2 n=1 Tax=Bifidobacterium tsurumiense TaxID=356829 RepID=A0A087E9K5_9BIFI|nr:PTS sugar transporter subunit IIA [Bifidobacterium tsurumiense]KFJ04456.1 putative phosphoenolpyruvate-dependent sugar phosphotransferase system, EIIA 2 [Bifidobacterium tsurumiense]MDY4677493.1 PTS sugar transporter subunit IIA [Bifidobacterium tsurumiense]
MERIILWHPKPAHTKAELLRKVVQELESRGLVTDSAEIITLLHERENLGSTLLTERLAIPHAQSEAITKAAIVYVATEDPIADWQSASRFIFTFLPEAPDRGDAYAIRDFFIRLADDDVAEALGECDEEQVLELLT